jgi:hypothetical protein
MSKLRSQLLTAMAPNVIFRAPVWGSPRAMTEALRDVRKSLGGNESELPDTNVLQESLRRFVSTRSVGSFTELKHVCYGVTVPVGKNAWSLIDRQPLFQSLLALIEQRSGQAKQYRRCYQGLLNGYFGFDRQTASSDGQANWVQLRSYLDQNLTPIVQATARSGLQLDWLQALSTHRNLLTEDPCSRYARDLRDGHTDELRLLCGALGIASTSWVWDEALMAYVRAVCDAADDRQFQRDMSGVLGLVNGRNELKLADMLCTRATALTVVRYSRCVERPEHHELRDTSLRCIGNPWVDRTAWDAHVQHEPARQMVEGWIKRRLIKDFFELLAHDGGADLRRLNYWLKWEPQITDMWFVLGWDARNNRSTAFEELRQRMVGRRRSLDDPNGHNNAFVMRIGPLLVIEFGVTGNACYAFAASDFKGDLDKPLLSIHVLKQRAGATRLSHMSAWESKFDFELRRLLQSVPSWKGELPTKAAAGQGRPPAAVAPPRASPSQSAPARTAAAPQSAAPPRPTPARAEEPPQTYRAVGALSRHKESAVKALCIQHGLKWEDHRSKKGAFWVLMSDRMRYLEFARFLGVEGFSYAPGKGFWIKDQE